jgi:hypothetical protein
MSGEIILGHPDSYSFLFDAAHEARQASQRHWAGKPMAADMDVIWPLNETPRMRVSTRTWIKRGKAGDGA